MSGPAQQEKFSSQESTMAAPAQQEKFSTQMPPVAHREVYCKALVKEYYWKLERAPHDLHELVNQDMGVPQGLLQRIEAFKGMSAQLHSLNTQYADGIDGDVLLQATGDIFDKKNPTNRRGFLQSFLLRPQQTPYYYMIVNDDFFEYTSEWTEGAPIVQEEDVDTELGNLGFIFEKSAPYGEGTSAHNEENSQKPAEIVATTEDVAKGKIVAATESKGSDLPDLSNAANVEEVAQSGAVIVSNAFTEPLAINRRIAVAEEVQRGGLPIHVSHLPRGVTKEMLLEAFSKYGPIDAVKVVKKQTYGFINFENAQHAQKAIEDGHIDIGGHSALISAVASKRMIKWDP